MKNFYISLVAGWISLCLPLSYAFEQNGDLANFARQHKLDTKEFTAAVQSIRQSGKLPHKFITKAEARKMGWQPGKPLHNYAPGKSIGGDRFGNRERKLPVKKGRHWFEADLNFKGKKRNALRLLWSNDKLVFFTPDHYRTFIKVP